MKKWYSLITVAVLVFAASCGDGAKKEAPFVQSQLSLLKLKVDEDIARVERAFSKKDDTNLPGSVNEILAAYDISRKDFDDFVQVLRAQLLSINFPSSEKLVEHCSEDDLKGVKAGLARLSKGWEEVTSFIRSSWALAMAEPAIRNESVKMAKSLHGLLKKYDFHDDLRAIVAELKAGKNSAKIESLMMRMDNKYKRNEFAIKMDLDRIFKDPTLSVELRKVAPQIEALWNELAASLEKLFKSQRITISQECGLFILSFMERN